jgi:fatty-acyl-CoA synthase
LDENHTPPRPAETNESPNKAWLRALEATVPIARLPNRIFPTVIEELADTFEGAPALLSGGKSLTFRDLAQRSNQYARWALEQRLAQGDAVCLLMPNGLEYLPVWIGITSVGGVVSLLNTNLTGLSLAHCINTVEPKHIIVAAELVDGFFSALPHLAGSAKTWLHGIGSAELPRIDLELDRHSGRKLTSVERRPVTIRDLALYIYTSGTTGLPKAAKINHYRIMQWSYWFAGMMNTRSSDRMYDCLPMYHSVGGVVATGAVLVNGGSVVIREKFSASNFWDDVSNVECTLFQFIGELCRYLVNTPPHPRETNHRIRLCCGNGLRPDVWNDFKTRFRIPQILEFYAATESNVALYNVEGEPGAIGRIPKFLAHRHSLTLLKFDFETGEPIRDTQGYCVRCAANEVGEAAGKIENDPSNPTSYFDGYTSREDSEKKILRDVFIRGDAWFRTGDLMRKDNRGYFYFIDRVGDTFRWKGENVATTEVSEVISAFPGVAEANVYGVAVPRSDGRAGMAALVIDPSFNLAEFARYLQRQLPHYARPVFLRICAAIESTPTFKPRKTDLMGQGYDPNISSDPIYFNDPERQDFVPLDGALYDRIKKAGLPSHVPWPHD